QAENPERIEEGMLLFLAAAGKHDGKDAARTTEIALPQFMIGMAGKCRVEDACDARLRFQPCGEVERARLVAPQPQTNRGKTGRDLVDVVGPCTAAKRADTFQQPWPAGFVCRYSAEQHVGMTGRIFCRRVDRDVDAVVERAKEQRRRPGVV